MPKRAKAVQLLEFVPSELLENLEIQSCNLTTNEQTTYEILSSKCLLENEQKVKTSYGVGPTAYVGQANQDNTLIVAQSQSNNSTNYLVRAVGNPAFQQVQKIVAENAPQFTDLKIANTQAIGGIEIPVGIDVEDLIKNCSESQKILKSKRIKLAVTSDGVLEIGTKTSSKNIKIALAKQKSNPSKKCLCITSIVKETSTKYLSILKQQNLEVGDIHALAIRDSFESLNDCDLKKIILSYIKNLFTLPSKEKMKAKKPDSLPSKVRYLKGALGSSLKYLDDLSLRDSTLSVLQEFLNELSSKGISNSNLNVAADVAATTVTKGRKSKSVAAAGEEKGGDS